MNVLGSSRSSRATAETARAGVGPLVSALIWLTTFLWGAFWISVALLATLLSLGSRRISLWLARRVWAPGQLAIAGGRLSAVGGEALAGLGGALVVANHGSLLDIPALFAAFPRPLHFVAKRELARVPFLGWYIRAMGMVFVERGGRRSALASVSQVAGILASGGLVVTFPAGTRGEDGARLGFKSGAFEAAIAASAPVLPVALRGSSAILAARGFLVRPGPIRVAIGSPISSLGLDRVALARRAEEAVGGLLAG